MGIVGDAVSKISEPNIKALALLAGNRCAFPKCPEILAAENGAISGKIAHIKGQHPGSARYDSSMTEDQRNHYKNLIFLCPNHHEEIDKVNPGSYPPERLHEIKVTHERWVSEQCRKQMPEVQFAELKVVTNYLAEAPIPQGGSFDVIPIKDKIHRNNLSAAVEADITLGLCRVSLVEDYIQRNLDPEFGNRLRYRFVNNYLELREKDGLRGDDLFYALWQFASGNSTVFRVQAAGLTVLVYLFQACDVFEK
jgi:hypothetical protein